MSSVNLATIRSTVRTRGDYGSSIKFTDAYLNLEIQSSWAELYELIAGLEEGYFDTSATAPTVAAQAYLNLPADCWRVRGVDLLSGSDYIELRQTTIGERDKYGSSAGQPIAFRLSSRGIEFFPTPSAVYTIRTTYTPTYLALDESVTTNFYNDWHDYVICGALLRLDQRSKRPLQEREAELGRIRQRIVDGASRRKSSEPEYLVLREDCGDWGYY